MLLPAPPPPTHTHTDPPRPPPPPPTVFLTICPAWCCCVPCRPRSFSRTTTCCCARWSRLLWKRRRCWGRSRWVKHWSHARGGGGRGGVFLAKKWQLTAFHKAAMLEQTRRRCRGRQQMGPAMPAGGGGGQLVEWRKGGGRWLFISRDAGGSSTGCVLVFGGVCGGGGVFWQARTVPCTSLGRGVGADLGGPTSSTASQGVAQSWPARFIVPMFLMLAHVQVRSANQDVVCLGAGLISPRA
jgi:hypothetical protein